MTTISIDDSTSCWMTCDTCGRCVVTEHMSHVLFDQGDEDQSHSGPSWAAEDDDDPENRYGSKTLDIVPHASAKCKQGPHRPHPKSGPQSDLKNALMLSPKPKSGHKRSRLRRRKSHPKPLPNTRSSQARPKRSCSQTKGKVKYSL